jgi:hypothetical protein
MEKQQELKKLINKSIGTKGSLEIPSFWMNKILEDMMDLLQENNENADKWMELYEKELKKLKNNITDKSDKILINSYEQSYMVNPNVYTTHTITSTANSSIILGSVSDPSIYNEYIMEINCTVTPSVIEFTDSNNNTINIKWANENAPIFAAGCTYIISIVNNFGVFAQFTNS